MRKLTVSVLILSCLLSGCIGFGYGGGGWGHGGGRNYHHHDWR
jgi:hypothetical protein